ncbi:MAG: hypothetical protein FWE61_06705 [Micrococcales bacterium]|nr:hypothetical protein [Micrococcales bacterium]
MKNALQLVESIDDLPEPLRALLDEDPCGTVKPMGEDDEWLVYDGDLVVDDDLVIDEPLAVTGNLVVNGVLRDADELPVVVGEDIVASVGVWINGAWLPGGECVTQIFEQVWAEHEGLTGSNDRFGDNLVALVGLWNRSDAQCNAQGFVIIDCRDLLRGPDDEQYCDFGMASDCLVEPFASRVRLDSEFFDDDEFYEMADDVMDAMGDDLFDEMCDAIREGRPVVAADAPAVPGASSGWYSRSLAERMDEYLTDIGAALVWWPAASEDYLLQEAAELDRARKVALRPWPLSLVVLDAAVATIGDDRRGLLALSRRTDLPADVRARVGVSLK